MGIARNVIALTLAWSSAAGAQAQDADTSAEKLAQRLEARRREAEALPLFALQNPVEFTLIANFRQISRDRDTLSTKRFAGTMIVPGVERVDTFPVEVRTRGHFRLARCSFVPIRIDFPGKVLKGTVFEGQKDLKVGVHCEGSRDYEQYVLREHLAYRLSNLISPRSFRSRLGKATYVDSASGKPVATKWALFIENEEDVGRRMGGKVEELRNALFDDVDSETITTLTVFNYMIGNHDWSLAALHNIRLVVTQPDRTVYPVPYDFDHSGLVNARYATPPPQLGLRTVKERLYRGPCRTPEQMEQVLGKFRAVREHALALVDSIPDLDPGYRKDAREYLDEFYRNIDRPRTVRSDLIDGCNKRGGA